MQLIQAEIVPAYSRLPGCKRVGLIRLLDSRDFITTQHWESREIWLACVESSDYAVWLEDYRPVLDQWDEMMKFVDESTGEELKVDRNGL